MKNTKLRFSYIFITVVFLTVLNFQNLYSDNSKAVPTADNNARGKGLSFEDSNYKFNLTENSPYQKMLFHHLINEEADFVLTDPKANVHFYVISEKLGKDQDYLYKDYAEEIKDDFILTADEVTVKEEVLTDIDRLTGKRISLVQKTAGTSYIYDIRSFNHNGIYYQLITYCWETKGFKKLKEEADYLAQKFKILDKEKEYYSEEVEVLEGFKSKYAPLDLKFKNKKLWFLWEDFKDDCPESEFAGNTINSNQRFCISSIIYDSNKHSDEIIANAFVRLFNLKLSDKRFSLVKKIDGKPFRSYKLKATKDIEGDDFDYYFDIYFAGNVAFAINFWGTAGTQETENAYKALQDAVIFTDRKVKIDWNNLSEDQAQTQSLLHNSAGLVYYRQENHEQAAACFQKAFKMDNNFINAATNSFWSLSKIKGIPKILQTLEENTHLLEYPEGMAWNAFCLKETKRFKESIAAYKKLFEFEGYENEPDFLDYSRLLLNQKMTDELDGFIKTYLSSEKEQSTYHQLCRLLMEFDQLKRTEMVLANLPGNFKESVETRRLYLRFYIANGNYNKADEHFANLLKDGHRDRQTLYTGADLYYDIGWYHKAKSTLNELLKVAPNDKEAKKLLDLTLGHLGEGNKGGTINPIDPVALPEELQKLTKSITLSEENESDIHYHYIFTSYSYKNNRLKKTIYRKFKLKTSTGVKDNATLYFNFNSNSSKIYVNKLTVTDPDGNSTAHSDRNAFYIKDTDDDLATEEKTLCMPVSSLQPGCVVEYVITEEKLANHTDFPFKRKWLCLSVPYEKVALSINGDVKDVSYKLINSDLKAIETPDNLLFITNSKVVYKSESIDAPAEVNYPLLILGSKKLTWEQEVADYLKKIQQKLVPSDTLKGLVNKITANEKSTEDKIQSLISYIQKNITYQGIEFGSRGIIPDTPLKVLNQKYGDCKDMAVLLHQMLKVLNVKSTLTLVSTDNEIHTGIPSMDQFNHMILYVNELDKFLDCTVKNANLLTVGNTYMHGSKALLLNAENSGFKTIPYYEVNTKAVSVNRKMRLIENDEIDVNEDITFTGYFAYFIRNSLLKTAIKERKEKVRDWVNYYPELEDFSMEIQNLDNYMENLVLKLNYRIKRAIKKVDGEKSVTIETPWLYFYVSSKKIENKFNPVKFYYDFSFSSVVEFDTGNLAGLKAEIPETSKKMSYFEGTVSSVVEKNRLIIKSDCLKKRGVYPAASYADYYEATKEYVNKSAGHIKLLPVTK